MAKGLDKLNPQMKQLFLKIQNKHMNCMGEKERNKHILQKVKVNTKEQCFEAYYNVEMYKYYPDLTWG